MHLPPHWTPVAEAGAALEAQLRVEVAAGHPLSGKQVTAIARCERCDEVLFKVADDPAWFAQVHLTWRQTVDSPPWPQTTRLSAPLPDHHH